MRLRLLLLLAALLAPMHQASAQGAAAANGIFLLAAPGLLDPNFHHAVVLVTQLPDGGSVGFIVNRPGERSLAQILPHNEMFKRFTEPLYLGGPVEAAGLFAMFRAKDNPPGALRVLDDLSFAMQPAVLEQLLHAPPAHVRFFNGYAGWAPGQLVQELARGGWYVLNADADSVFRKDTGTLWQDLLLRVNAVTASAPDQLSGVSSDTPSRARRVSQRFGR
jgi:putative transcriptional regulator